MAAVSGNPALWLRTHAREAMLLAGGRGFMRFLPPGDALLATDALSRCAEQADAARLTDALSAAGFACTQRGALLGVTPSDALLLRAAQTAAQTLSVDWDGLLCPAQALSARWLRKEPQPLTPRGRALAMETLRLLWQPQGRVLAGLSSLRALAAENLRAGDASGQLEAGCFLAAWLTGETTGKEERT